jgi:predicted transcriptional regulator
MVIKNFYLTTPQIAALEKLAKEKDLSVSELIRRAIDEYLDKQKKNKPVKK